MCQSLCASHHTHAHSSPFFLLPFPTRSLSSARSLAGQCLRPLASPWSLVGSAALVDAKIHRWRRRREQGERGEGKEQKEIGQHTSSEMHSSEENRRKVLEGILAIFKRLFLPAYPTAFPANIFESGYCIDVMDTVDHVDSALLFVVP